MSKNTTTDPDFPGQPVILSESFGYTPPGLASAQVEQGMELESELVFVFEKIHIFSAFISELES